MAALNLLREAWIPALRADGRRVPIRPADLTDPSLVRIDTGRPDCDVALMELLIGLLAVSLDPHVTGTWWIDTWREPPSAEALDAAFAPFASAFEMDGDGPRWFQDREELQGEDNPVEALAIDAVNKHFQKVGRLRVLSRRGAAILLATLQMTAPAGGAGHRTSVRGGGPLTTLVVPGTVDGREASLWHKLWANVPEGYGATPDQAGLVFPWLVPTRISSKGSATPTTTPAEVHKAQVFFGMPRRIRLRFSANVDRLPCDLTGEIDDVIVVDYVTRPGGNNYEGWGRLHPLSPSYKLKATSSEYLPLHLRSGRIGYREWVGYVFREPTAETTLPAAAVETFYTQRAGDLQDVSPSIVQDARLFVAAYVMDNMKSEEYAEAVLPLMAMAGDLPAPDRASVLQAVNKLAHGRVSAADLAARAVAQAVRLGLFGDGATIAPDATPLETARAQLWAGTESAFFARLPPAATRIAGAISTGQDLAPLAQDLGMEWLNILRAAALSVFDAAVPLDAADGRDPADYRRIVEARKGLVHTFTGLTKTGGDLYKHLSLPLPERKRRTKAAA